MLLHTQESLNPESWCIVLFCSVLYYKCYRLQQIFLINKGIMIPRVLCVELYWHCIAYFLRTKTFRLHTVYPSYFNLHKFATKDPGFAASLILFLLDTEWLGAILSTGRSSDGIGAIVNGGWPWQDGRMAGCDLTFPQQILVQHIIAMLQFLEQRLSLFEMVEWQVSAFSPTSYKINK